MSLSRSILQYFKPDDETFQSTMYISKYFTRAFVNYFQQAIERFQSSIQPYDCSARVVFKPTASGIVTNPLQLCTLLLLISILVLVFQTIFRRFFHLQNFHGPTTAAYTRLWLCRTIASGDSANIFVDINKKYGSLARIGPNNLLTDDPNYARRILAARSHYTRGPWFDSFRIDPNIPNIVSERDPGKHNHLRYQMSAGYAGKDIEGLESVISERITDFVDRIDRNWVSEPWITKRFDIATRIQFLAMDIITHLTFGKPLGFVETDSDVKSFLFTIESQLPIVQHFSVILELNTIMLRAAALPWLKKFLTPSARDATGIGMIMGISQRVINERFAPHSVPKKDMLGSFIERGLSRTEIETEIAISLVAGSDTTATSMRATLLSIISNPQVYQRLVREIDNAVLAGKLSSPILNEEAKKLPFLQACIKEGLRRFPPITQLRERMVPPEGDYYNGRHIPGGTYIGLNAWGLQLNAVYGEDPEVFRPERWLIADDDRLQEMMRVHELIFGYGTTKCLGIPIVMMNLNKIFVELFRRFDISLINPTKPWNSTCYVWKPSGTIDRLMVLSNGKVDSKRVNLKGNVRPKISVFDLPDTPGPPYA